MPSASPVKPLAKIELNLNELYEKDYIGMGSLSPVIDGDLDLRKQQNKSELIQEKPLLSPKIDDQMRKDRSIERSQSLLSDKHNRENEILRKLSIQVEQMKNTPDISGVKA